MTTKTPPFSRVLVANRGEIAVRIIRACHEMGMLAVAVYSDADVDAQHVRMADTAVRLGPAAPAESYLRIDAIVEAAVATGAEAIHPGYGFLSERAAFARAVEAAGIVFVGPSSTVIDALGDKLHARRVARDVGVPAVPGTIDPAPVDRPDAVGRHRRRSGADRLPIARQGCGRRRGTGDAPGGAGCRPAGRAGRRIGRSGVIVRRRVRLPGARDPTGPPHRGPAAGRRNGPDRRHRRARLLAPAPASEAGRGGARAGSFRRRAAPTSMSWRSGSRPRPDYGMPRRQSSCGPPMGRSTSSR